MDNSTKIINLQNQIEYMLNQHNKEVKHVCEMIGEVIDLLSDQNVDDFEQKAIDILINISLSTFTYSRGDENV